MVLSNQYTYSLTVNFFLQRIGKNFWYQFLKILPMPLLADADSQFHIIIPILVNADESAHPSRKYRNTCLQLIYIILDIQKTSIQTRRRYYLSFLNYFWTNIVWKSSEIFDNITPPMWWISFHVVVCLHASLFSCCSMPTCLHYFF